MLVLSYKIHESFCYNVVLHLLVISYNLLLYDQSNLFNGAYDNTMLTLNSMFDWQYHLKRILTELKVNTNVAPLSPFILPFDYCDSDRNSFCHPVPSFVANLLWETFLTDYLKSGLKKNLCSFSGVLNFEFGDRNRNFENDFHDICHGQRVLPHEMANMPRNVYSRLLSFSFHEIAKHQKGPEDSVLNDLLCTIPAGFWYSLCKCFSGFCQAKVSTLQNRCLFKE